MSSKDSRAQSTLKKLDIFSIPFQFSFGSNEKEKRTWVGGFLSLIIIILSASYFVYLCDLYFENKIQPSISSTHEYSLQPFPIEITKSFFAIKIVLGNGQSLSDYQQQKGKVYLTLQATLFTNGQQPNAIQTPLIPCADANLAGYFCLDTKTLTGGLDESIFLEFTPNNIERQNISLFLSICDQQFLSAGQICESEQVIRDTVISYSTQISVRLEFTQYNTKTKQNESRIKEEPFYFDSDLSFYTKFNLQKTNVNISEGFLIQSVEERTFLSDYVRKDITASQSFILTQVGFKALGGIVIFIGQDNLALNIQFPQFTNLLAQFTSVFNSLLFIGFFSKILAQTEIIKQFGDIQLKIYFKKSALQLLEDVGYSNDIKNAKNQGVLGLWNFIQNFDFKVIGKKIKLSFFNRQSEKIFYSLQILFAFLKSKIYYLYSDFILKYNNQLFIKII